MCHSENRYGDKQNKNRGAGKQCKSYNHNTLNIRQIKYIYDKSYE